MTSDLNSSLPLLVPKAISWAEAQANIAQQEGRPLAEPLLSLARAVGVANPERIRILDVPTLPVPEDSDLRAAANTAGLFGPRMVGLTLGYAVLICSGYGQDIRLLSHEFRHVHQYESAGSIAGFLPGYLQQVLTFGYANAPLEIDARAYERQRA